MHAVITDQGTAMAEAALCDQHYAAPFTTRAEAMARQATDVSDPLQWADTIGNPELQCAECGANDTEET